MAFCWRALLVVSSFCLQGAQAVHACDSEQSSGCPAFAGAGLGACLKDSSKHEAPITISSGCEAFIKTNDACSKEIEEKCQGMFYSDDTMVCLTQWTRPEDLGADCVATLPKKEEESEEVDESKKEWRAKRKAERTRAMKAMREVPVAHPIMLSENMKLCISAALALIIVLSSCKKWRSAERAMEEDKAERAKYLMEKDKYLMERANFMEEDKYLVEATAAEAPAADTERAPAVLPDLRAMEEDKYLIDARRLGQRETRVRTAAEAPAADTEEEPAVLSDCTDSDGSDL